MSRIDNLQIPLCSAGGNMFEREVKSACADGVMSREDPGTGVTMTINSA